MRPQSAKAKGRRLQQWVRDTLLKFAASLQPDDIRSTSMGAQGEDLLFSPAARVLYPFSIECKNVEKLNIHEAMAQSEAHIEPDSDLIPIVVFKRNHSKVYVALEFERFLKLTRK
jgi:hypothetical protein